MVDVYIQAGLRTPIGLFQKQYANTRPEYLGAAILNALKKRYPESQIDDIICGNAVGTGGNIGRLTGLIILKLFLRLLLICSALQQVPPWVLRLLR